MVLREKTKEARRREREQRNKRREGKRERLREEMLSLIIVKTTNFLEIKTKVQEFRGLFCFVIIFVFFTKICEF